MKQGLVVIDVQNDYFSGGSMELVGIDEAALNCNQLINAFRQTNAPIFHIQHIAVREGASFFAPDTFGCEIHDSVRPLDNEIVVIKHYPNSFRETKLNELLTNSGVDELIICGAMTHMCIDSTTRAAFDLGYKCHVVSDACATRDLEFNGQAVKAAEVQAAFMAALRVPFADISSTEEYLSIVK